MPCRRTAYTVTDAQRQAIVNRERIAAKAPPEKPAASILLEVEAFLRRHPHMSASRLGREAVNDPQAVHTMRKGVTTGTVRIARFRAFMAGYTE